MAINELEIPGLRAVAPQEMPAPPDPATFHGRLRLLHEQLGISIRQMARDISVNDATLGTWFAGTPPTKPSQVEVIERVARTYGGTDGYYSLRDWLAWGDDSLSPAYAGIEWDLRAQRIEVREAWGRREHDLAS